MSTTDQARVGLSDPDPAVAPMIRTASRRRPRADRVAQLDAYTAEMRQLSWATLQQTCADLTPTEQLRLWRAGQ